jgi:hypothetical protein
MRQSIHKQHVKETDVITCMFWFMLHQHQGASTIIVQDIYTFYTVIHPLESPT